MPALGPGPFPFRRANATEPSQAPLTAAVMTAEGLVVSQSGHFGALELRGVVAPLPADAIRNRREGCAPDYSHDGHAHQRGPRLTQQPRRRR